MDQGDERAEDLTTDDGENRKAVYEADTAKLQAIAPPATTPDDTPDAIAHVLNGTGDTGDAPDPGAGEGSAGAPDGMSPEQPTPAEPALAGGVPLAPGTLVGGYRVERLLQSSVNEATYLAVEVETPSATPDESESSIPPPAHVILFERAPGGFAAATGVIALRLRHPRLLAPRELLEHAGREYLVVETIVRPDGTLAQTAAQGARLDPAATLAAGAGLADALSYLHRNGVAHLHVSPDVIVVHGERAYLSGMEGAERIIQSTGDLITLFARDANFLARSLGVLAGLPDGPDANEDATRQILRQIVIHGAANSFATMDDVAATCAAALQNAPAFALSGESAAGRLTFLSAAASSVGRVRAENQDACARIVFDIYDDVSGDMPLNVFLVADGMGGEAHGEIASRIAARVLPAELARGFIIPELLRPVEAATEEEPSARIYSGDKPSLGTALARAVNAANRHVRELAAMLGQTTGTTLTVIATRGSQAALAHLGDSRAYLLRGDTLAQLTEDHSVLARLQAIDHPLLSDPDVFVPRSMLYRSLGQEDEASPDTLDFTLTDGDRLLICSDGLWDELDDYTIAETLASATDPRACAERLVEMANAAGGHDNSTAVAIFVRSAPNPSDTSREDVETDSTVSEAEDPSPPEEL